MAGNSRIRFLEADGHTTEFRSEEDIPVLSVTFTSIGSSPSRSRIDLETYVFLMRVKLYSRIKVFFTILPFCNHEEVLVIIDLKHRDRRRTFSPV